LSNVVISLFNGYIFFDERELGEKTNDDELRAMINEFDKNGDGESKWTF
jgi:Ca2+-binding EF-hand superfamily protein